jgi:hypothetical protein
MSRRNSRHASAPVADAALLELEAQRSALVARARKLADQEDAIVAHLTEDEAEKEFGGAVPTDDDFNLSILLILLGFSALADAEQLIAQIGK